MEIEANNEGYSDLYSDKLKFFNKNILHQRCIFGNLIQSQSDRFFFIVLSINFKDFIEFFVNFIKFFVCFG